MSDITETNNNEMTFESAIAELEMIVKYLEDGNVPLDSSIEKFERGSMLVKFCNRKLDEAEAKIKLLMKDKDGNINEQDFGSNQ